MNRNFTLLLLLCFIFVGCTPNSSHLSNTGSDDILNQMDRLEKEIQDIEDKLESLPNDIRRYERNEDWDRYNDAVAEYNALIDHYPEMVDIYNDYVELYNKTH